MSGTSFEVKQEVLEIFDPSKNQQYVDFLHLMVSQGLVTPEEFAHMMKPVRVVSDEYVAEWDIL